jgi:histidinol-phosphate phosphatase family protein
MLAETARGCEVAILAGGAGTRLKARTGRLPKPMAPLMGQPVLAHLLDLCRRHGFLRIALLVHYEHEVISDHFGDGKAHGVQLTYVVEGEARGTAGALWDALPLMADRYLVLYGDTYADVDLRRVWHAHNDCGAAATLLLHPNDHPHDSDLVEVGPSGRVVAIHSYPHPDGFEYANLVNAALYVMERASLEPHVPAAGKFDLAKHTFPAMLAAGCHLQGVLTPEYIKDMGTPERLDKVERDILVGLPERLSARRLRTAVFLDRDGTLNEEVGHLREPTQIQLLPGVADAVRRLNRAGRIAVCVTNQPVLARGDVTAEQLNQIHARLDHLLGQSGAYLDRLYHCPHHPDRGFPGEVPELKMACTCRKPGTGMFDQAVRDLAIDRRSSWMIGDTTTDVRAGRLAGLRTILLRTGHGGRDGKCPGDLPDYNAPDLAAAVAWVIEGHPATVRQTLPVAEAAAGARLVILGGAARSGKSAAAQVLKEQLADTDRTVHIVSIDGWLWPAAQRQEGQGVMARYDLAGLETALSPLWLGGGRHRLEVPLYDRDARRATASLPISVGPDDLVIVEGVPALMSDALRASAAVRVFVECDDELRHARLRADYLRRQPPLADLDRMLRSRELEELPAVRASAAHATHHIRSQ